MTKMILSIKANFFLIYFLVFISSEARTLLEKQHEQKVVKSGYGKEPAPLPPSPESASPSNQERLGRHAHLPPPAPKHGPKIDEVTSNRHGRESNELLMTITSNVISDNELLIFLPSTSSDNQERFGKHGIPLPPPQPADEQGQVIVTSSNCQDGSKYSGREEQELPPPSPHHNAPIDQVTTSRHGRESSDLLMTITSDVISDNELLILLPSTSSDNQERFGKHGIPLPPPKPADDQHQIIVS
ncbi:hydroxyproline-rich systemin [Nicotiana sylvestris]|uniref:Hydroxyproline-rich systemin-like n=1 Tax=Nicotiana sylvestris TaxID=4096 RepID=A0A1U7X652_NICSY|nr:PREDICTED: hydroxyproline-rich systemin-like [Nicotiana sylvestris]